MSGAKLANSDRPGTATAPAGGGSGAPRIASSAIRAAATSADSSWLVAVTVNAFSGVGSTRTHALCRVIEPLALLLRNSLKRAFMGDSRELRVASTGAWDCRSRHTTCLPKEPLDVTHLQLPRGT